MLNCSAAAVMLTFVAVCMWQLQIKYISKYINWVLTSTRSKRNQKCKLNRQHPSCYPFSNLYEFEVLLNVVLYSICIVH